MPNTITAAIPKPIPPAWNRTDERLIDFNFKETLFISPSSFNQKKKESQLLNGIAFRAKHQTNPCSPDHCDLHYPLKSINYLGTENEENIREMLSGPVAACRMIPASSISKALGTTPMSIDLSAALVLSYPTIAVIP